MVVLFLEKSGNLRIIFSFLIGCSRPLGCFQLLIWTSLASPSWVVALYHFFRSLVIAFFVYCSRIRCLPVSFPGIWLQSCSRFEIGVQFFVFWFHYFFVRRHYWNWWSVVYYEFFSCSVYSHGRCQIIVFVYYSFISVDAVDASSAVFSLSVTSVSSVCFCLLICRLSRSGPFSRNYWMFVLVRDICVLGSSLVHCRIYTVCCYWVSFSVLSQNYPFFGSVILLSLFWLDISVSGIVFLLFFFS